MEQRSQNNGQTFIRMQTSNGMRFGLNVTGNFGGLNPGWMQNLIHDWIVPTKRFDFKDAKGSIQGEVGVGTPID